MEALALSSCLAVGPRTRLVVLLSWKSSPWHRLKLNLLIFIWCKIQLHLNMKELLFRETSKLLDPKFNDPNYGCKISCLSNSMVIQTLNKWYLSNYKDMKDPLLHVQILLKHFDWKILSRAKSKYVMMLFWDRISNFATEMKNLIPDFQCNNL